jgi:hypothetical protein
MVDYSAARTVIDASRAELREIFRWVRDRGEDVENPVTVLIGGWAVHSYNPWYGSIDIDLVTNHRTRQRLMKYLREVRHFSPKKHPMIRNTVVKHTPDGEIVIDFGSRDDVCRFEGRNEECPFSLLTGQTDLRELGEGISVAVPTRTLLLLFKLKAVWDRSYRIKSHRSDDEEWEQGKVRKDRADILALLDPDTGGMEIDIRYLGEKLGEYPFLKDIIREIPRDTDAVALYRRMTQQQVQDIIDRLLLLVG